MVIFPVAPVAAVGVGMGPPDEQAASATARVATAAARPQPPRALPGHESSFGSRCRWLEQVGVDRRQEQRVDRLVLEVDRPRAVGGTGRPTTPP